MAEISPRENPDFEQALISLMDRVDRIEEGINQLAERVRELEEWKEAMME
jgi:exonuclease VII small subunit